jgi:hypothetical protein
MPLFSCTGELITVELSTVQDLLKKLMEHSRAVPFLQPVDHVTYPEYSKFIKQPMDLGTVSKKLEGGVYRFVQDVRCPRPFLHPCPRRTLPRCFRLRVYSCAATFS